MEDCLPYAVSEGSGRVEGDVSTSYGDVPLPPQSALSGFECDDPRALPALWECFKETYNQLGYDYSSSSATTFPANQSAAACESSFKAHTAPTEGTGSHNFKFQHFRSGRDSYFPEGANEGGDADLASLPRLRNRAGTQNACCGTDATGSDSPVSSFSSQHPAPRSNPSFFKTLAQNDYAGFAKPPPQKQSQLSPHPPPPPVCPPKLNAKTHSVLPKKPFYRSQSHNAFFDASARHPTISPESIATGGTNEREARGDKPPSFFVTFRPDPWLGGADLHPEYSFHFDDVEQSWGSKRRGCRDAPHTFSAAPGSPYQCVTNYSMVKPLRPSASLPSLASLGYGHLSHTKPAPPGNMMQQDALWSSSRMEAQQNAMWNSQLQKVRSEASLNFDDHWGCSSGLPLQEPSRKSDMLPGNSTKNADRQIHASVHRSESFNLPTQRPLGRVSSASSIAGSYNSANKYPQESGGGVYSNEYMNSHVASRHPSSRPDTHKPRVGPPYNGYVRPHATHPPLSSQQAYMLTGRQHAMGRQNMNPVIHTSASDHSLTNLHASHLSCGLGDHPLGTTPFSQDDALYDAICATNTDANSALLDGTNFLFENWISSKLEFSSGLDGEALEELKPQYSTEITESAGCDSSGEKDQLPNGQFKDILGGSGGMNKTQSFGSLMADRFKRGCIIDNDAEEDDIFSSLASALKETMYPGANTSSCLSFSDSVSTSCTKVAKQPSSGVPEPLGNTQAPMSSTTDSQAVAPGSNLASSQFPESPS